MSKINWWAIVIGAGLALFPVHNQFLTRLTTTKSGDTFLFIPSIALFLVIMATGMFLTRKQNWERVKANGWGNPKVAIPLGVIVLAIGLSGLPTQGLLNKLAPLFMGIVLFGLYLASRILGKEIFLPLGIGAAIASAGVIIYQIAHPGTVTGGYVFEGNYDIVAGYVLLGAALFIHKWRWALAGLATIAMLLTGSPEALFSLAVVGIAVLVRRDWPRKTIYLKVAAVLIIPVIFLAARYGPTLYRYTMDALKDTPTAVSADKGTRQPITYRLEVIKDAMTHIKPLGNGYTLTTFYTGIVHNVPLIIVQELGWPGVLAGAAWLWIAFYCLVKTKWKYAWILVLSLGVFDHFLWDQLVVWIPCIIGASLASTENDYIFRREKCQEPTQKT